MIFSERVEVSALDGGADCAIVGAGNRVAFAIGAGTEG